MSNLMTNDDQDLVKQWLVLNIDRETRRYIKRIAEDRGVTVAKALKHLVTTYDKATSLMD